MRLRRLLATAPAFAGALLTSYDEPDPAATAAWQGPADRHPVDLRQAILAWAMLAPSHANTQPWRVQLAGVDRMLVRPDPTRRLTARDPAGR
jgi:hypothetical protein